MRNITSDTKKNAEGGVNVYICASLCERKNKSAGVLIWTKIFNTMLYIVRSIIKRTFTAKDLCVLYVF